MRLLIVVKGDTVYKKIQQMFAHHEVLRNIPHYTDLQEFVLGEEANLAIIEETVHWRARAEALLSKYQIPVIVFRGNFDELQMQVDGPTQPKTKVTPTISRSGGHEAPAEPKPIPPETPKHVEKQIVEKIVEKIVEVPVERVIEKPVERIVEVPVERVIEKVVEKPVKVIVEKEVEREVERVTVFPNKKVVVGSLYPGAGSTFVAITFSRMLSHLGIESAVVESPVNEPELYELLYGGEHAPTSRGDDGQDQPYRFLSDQILADGRVTRRDREWIQGKTTWYPANPKGIQGTWTYEHTLKLLAVPKSPIVFYDISHHWLHPSVQSICNDADEILFVCDTSPSKFSRTDTRAHTTYLSELKSAGKSVRVVGNRDIESKHEGRKDWIRSMPIPPVCLVPEIPYQQVIESLWDGRLAQDDPEIQAILMEKCYKMMRLLIPPAYPLEPAKEKKRGLLTKFFAKKGAVGT